MAQAGLAAKAQAELGVGENFGVGGAFAKWGAVPVTPRNFFRLLQRKEVGANSAEVTQSSPPRSSW